jgi:hypothetical protein
MSTATDTSVDELIDLFAMESPEDADPCEMIRRITRDGCPNEAVFIVRWGPADVGEHMACQCRRTSHLCLRHGERAMKGRLDPAGAFWCRVCDKLMIAVHVDRLRRAA